MTLIERGHLLLGVAMVTVDYDNVLLLDYKHICLLVDFLFFLPHNHSSISTLEKIVKLLKFG